MAEKELEVVTNNPHLEEPTYIIKKGSTKKHEIYFYSCVRRYYNILDRTTKEITTKRMWIVIGDGHKRYRKFETQADAVKYFRKLKKFARMRIQSVNSKEFVRMVSTFMLMEHKGVDPNLLAAEDENQVHDDSTDFVDQFAQYEVVEAQEEVVPTVDHEEIDRVLAEQEGDAFAGDAEAPEVEPAAPEVVADDVVYLQSFDGPAATPSPAEVAPETSAQAEAGAEANPVEEEVAAEEEKEPASVAPAAAPAEVYEAAPIVVEEPQHGRRNPCLFEEHHGKRGFIIAYDLVKYLIVVAMFIFALAAFWYNAKWERNALFNLVDLEPYKSDAEVLKWMQSSYYVDAAKLGITEWFGIGVSSGMMLAMVIMAALGFIMAIVTLTTKRCSVVGLTSLFLAFVALITVLVLFSTIWAQVQSVIGSYKSFINNNKGTYQTPEDLIKVIKDLIHKTTGVPIADIGVLF